MCVINQASRECRCQRCGGELRRTERPPDGIKTLFTSLGLTPISSTQMANSHPWNVSGPTKSPPRLLWKVFGAAKLRILGKEWNTTNERKNYIWHKACISCVHSWDCAVTPTSVMTNPIDSSNKRPAVASLAGLWPKHFIPQRASQQNYSLYLKVRLGNVTLILVWYVHSTEWQKLSSNESWQNLWPDF